MNSNEYPALVQFLGGYFHQDFLLDYGNPEGAIAAYLAGEPQDSVRAVCSELEQAVPFVERMHDPEKFLWRVLGCYYSPKADGLTVVDWLRYVRNKLCG